MLPDRVSNPGPLTYESGALPIALCGPAPRNEKDLFYYTDEKRKGSVLYKNETFLLKLLMF